MFQCFRNIFHVFIVVVFVGVGWLVHLLYITY